MLFPQVLRRGTIIMTVIPPQAVFEDMEAYCRKYPSLGRPNTERFVWEFW